MWVFDRPSTTAGWTFGQVARNCFYRVIVPKSPRCEFEVGITCVYGGSQPAPRECRELIALNEKAVATENLVRGDGVR